MGSQTSEDKGLKGLYTLEFSQHSYERDMIPYHIAEINETVNRNFDESFNNRRGANRRELIFVGTELRCIEVMQVHEVRLHVRKSQGTRTGVDWELDG